MTWRITIGLFLLVFHCHIAMGENRSRAYLVTNSASINSTSIHIVNSSDAAQVFTGTLFEGSGTQLGEGSQVLHNGSVAPEGRIILSAKDLEAVFGVDTWPGPAMLEVEGSGTFEIVTALTSPSGLVSNTNCVRETDVHNLEGAGSVDTSYLRLINIGETAINTIRGTLVDQQGRPLGESHARLMDNLPPKSQTWISRSDLESLIGTTWADEASLLMTAPHPNLRLLNLNLTSADTFFNFSCFEDEERSSLFLVTNAQSINQSELHLINSSADTVSFTGQLVEGDGATTDPVELAADIEPAGRRVLSATQLETLFGVESWHGPAMVNISGPAQFDAMIKLTSPSGLTSNTNCVRQSSVHMIKGEGRSFIRFINNGNQDIGDIRGTLYDATGMTLGQADRPLIASLSAGKQQFMNNDDLAAIFEVNWSGPASLVVTADNDDELFLLNLNLVEDATFFNFSCYENSDRRDATTAGEFHDQYIASPIIETGCLDCHSQGGTAQSSDLIFDDDYLTTLSVYVANNGDGLLSQLQDSSHSSVSLSSTQYEKLVGLLRLLNVDVAPALAGNLIPVSTVPGISAPLSINAGHPAFMSPHVNPVVAGPDYIYVANTPADTVDVINPWSRSVVQRINVGIDPVSLAVRPDASELWVANHISDTISVIDTDALSPTYHQVIATVQSLAADTRVTTFDEPTGIAFSASGKAFVALGPANEIAVIENYQVTQKLAVRAQDPRAIAVRDDRLYVIPFESNNQTQLSGCTVTSIDGETCTFNAVDHVFNNNNVLSTHYDADIVKHPGLPDRDLFVYDTESGQELEVVEGIGTLLYGITTDSQHRVFIAQADARNDANGKAGTLKHGLAEMENRAFLNQVTQVNCVDNCTLPLRIDLEPLPPDHPGPGDALATPYAITFSDDEEILFITAAGSNKLFSMNPEDGTVTGRVEVGAVPRGIAVTADQEAFVLNVVDNSVTVVDVSNPANMSVRRTISLDDPTDADIKAGRRLFNDANMSTTKTFSCESCHPDGHTDQLLWILDTPQCDIAGCTQIPPRLTMPVRGARDTGPYHWDGIPGDPFGGNNTASINSDVAPNCSEDDPEGCARVLVDGSLATTMCEIGNCASNAEGLAGAFDEEDRNLLSKFVLSVPYPPAPSRPFDNALSNEAREGFFNFSFVNNASGMATGAQTCGDCHKMPFLVSTNTPGTGMDAPTWRGAYDRWMILPQGRLNIIDLLNLVNMNTTFPERDMWLLAGSTEDNWQMVLEGSTGHAGAFGRQVTLSQMSADETTTLTLMNTLESAAADQAILLEAEGVWIDGNEVTAASFEYSGGGYRDRTTFESYERTQLINAAREGLLTLTMTGRTGQRISYDDPQPAIWPTAHISTQTRNVELALLADDNSLQFNARHLQPEAQIFINGSRVEGSVNCVSGEFPDCQGELVEVTLLDAPMVGGLHFLQLKNAGGLFSNDMMFFDEQHAPASRPGNLIASGGTFTNGFEEHWNTVELVTDSIRIFLGEVHVNIRETSTDPWRAQLSHSVLVTEGQEYTLCYDARATGNRFMTAYLDTNLDDYQNLSGGQFRSDLTTTSQRFAHTFTASQTDLRARVAFDFAQSTNNVQIDNIGLYEGSACGQP